MNKWHVALIALGIVIGFTAASLFGQSSDKEFRKLPASLVEVGSGRPISTNSDPEHSPALVHAEMSGTDTAAPLPLGSLDELNQRVRDAVLEKETEKLLAAGFSMDRIVWIQDRIDELRVQQERNMFEKQKMGIAPEPGDFSFIFDSDIGLKDELGLPEYERYREALGRPMGVGIAEVLPGSLAERVGMMPEDVILSYGGERVFNGAELNQELNQSMAGESVIIEVRRDGQTLQLVVPSGPLGIRNKFHPPGWLGS